MSPAHSPSEPPSPRPTTSPTSLPEGTVIDGFEWTLSDETRATLADIDASIRQARIDGPTALFD